MRNLSGLILLLLVGFSTLVACSGGVDGDSGEEALAHKALQAFINGDFQVLIDTAPSENKNNMDMMRKQTIQSWKDMKEDRRKEALKKLNKDMKKLYDDWEKIETPEDFDEERALQYFFSRFQKVRKNAEDFEERAQEMELISYRRTFQENPDWGSATIGFSNPWEETVEIRLIQREGVWYISELNPKGFDLDKDD